MNFNFSPCAIGSLPHINPKKSVQVVLDYFNKIPFWPQLPQRTFLEGIGTQFSEGLPNLIINQEKKQFYIDTKSNLDKAITGFYERFLANDLASFAISKEYSAGFYELLSQIKSRPACAVLGTADRKPLPKYLKGQVTGPLTFSALVTDEQGNPLLNHPLLSDVLVKNLIMKARWQIGEFRKLSPKVKQIIFLDEPYLMGYGSAYIPLTRETVISQLTEVINEIHKEDVLVGIHCCGNTDWSLILDTSLDILSFDAYGFIDKLLLYSDKLREYIIRGGVIAWGIVPSVMLDSPPSAQELLTKLKNAIKTLVKNGVDSKRLTGQSLITPSCGLGGLSEPQAEERLKLLTDISKTLSR